MFIYSICVCYLSIGRCAFTRRLKAPAEKVLWHSDGSHYLLVLNMRIQVFSAADNACVCDVALTSRINQVVFTATADVDGTSSGEVRIASVCENMVLYLHSLTGAEVL